MGNFCCPKKSIIIESENQHQVQGAIGELAIEENMWNNLPPEIWILIFKQFSSIKDVQNCHSTCQKWQSIIKTLFEDKGKHFLLC